jgi:hypothetical protein
MNKWVGKLKLIWFFIKTVFATDVELHRSRKGKEGAKLNWRKYQNTVQDFLDKYNVNAEDKIDYTNTHKHHHSNFAHLDDPNSPEFKDANGGERVLEQVGLVYEKDGKTPRNPAEVFDMTYEEYTKYREKILPRAATKKITYGQIKRFVERERGIQKGSTKKVGEGTKPARKRTYKKRRPKTSYKKRAPKEG